MTDSGQELLVFYSSLKKKQNLIHWLEKQAKNQRMLFIAQDSNETAKQKKSNCWKNFC
jgi:hypothetical protein